MTSSSAEDKYSHLLSLRDEELTRAMGLALYDSIPPRESTRAGLIVDRLLLSDRNELLMLLRNPQNLEQAVSQIASTLPEHRGKTNSLSLSDLSSPSPNHVIDPGDTAPGGSGAALGGGHNNDQINS